jgi:hypothetical protein
MVAVAVAHFPFPGFPQPHAGAAAVFVYEFDSEYIARRSCASSAAHRAAFGLADAVRGDCPGALNRSGGLFDCNPRLWNKKRW